MKENSFFIPMENDILTQSFEKLNLKPKESLNIVFVGHVDAGKSTICGQILVLLNIVDQRTLDKLSEESKAQGRETWYLSRLFDTNPEEKEKGKTTELGIASFVLNNKNFNILDAPGHKQYIFEMISGANSADVGILVISARINEFESGFEKGGQTREHILLMKAGSIKSLVVLVNKMDDLSVKWSEERFKEIEKKIGSFVKLLYKNVVFIPISGYTGENIQTKKQLIWYNGPTFFEYLQNIEVSKQNIKNFDILITEKNKPNLITGKIEGLSIKKDTILKLIPQNVQLQLNTLYTMDDVEIEEANTGETIKIKLSKSLEDLSIGNRLINIENMTYLSSNTFTCRITILDCDSIICKGFKCILHIGIISVQCKILEIRDLKNKKLRFVRAGTKVLAKIESEKSLLLNKETMDKFALRLCEKTLGVGIVRKIL